LMAAGGKGTSSTGWEPEIAASPAWISSAGGGERRERTLDQLDRNINPVWRRSADVDYQ
jgi:hypothetical protein